MHMHMSTHMRRGSARARAAHSARRTRARAISAATPAPASAHPYAHSRERAHAQALSHARAHAHAHALSRTRARARARHGSPSARARAQRACTRARGRFADSIRRLSEAPPLIKLSSLRKYNGLFMPSICSPSLRFVPSLSESRSPRPIRRSPQASHRAHPPPSLQVPSRLPARDGPASLSQAPFKPEFRVPFNELQS
jgi:hypothetical protein